MLFNDVDQLAISEIVHKVESDATVLMPIMQGLVKAGLLITTEELNDHTDESARLKLNMDFTRFVLL
jgi:hypothetical protein